MPRRLIPVVALILAAGPLVAQRPPSFDPYRNTIATNLRLYTDPAIQAELKLTDEQKAKLAKLPDELVARHKEDIEKEQAAEKEASEKQAAQAAELTKKFDAMVEKHLTADQRKRLNQLAVQAMGVRAFYDDEVVKPLTLPKDFLTKLSEIQQAAQEKMLKEYPNANAFPPSLPAEERLKITEARRKMVQDNFAQFVATFTDEQKKAWKELVGEPSEAVGAAGTGVGGFGIGGRGSPFSISLPLRSSAQAGLLTNDKALAELKVEKAAREAIAADWKAIQDAAQANGGRGRGGPGGFAASVSRTLAQETVPAARKVLTEPQVKRLEQIRFQMNGTGVFSATGIVDPVEYVTATGGGTFSGRPVTTRPLVRLTLTPAQVTKIDAVLADAATKQRELGPQRGGFGGFGNPFAPPDAELTDAQKARLEEARKAREELQRKSNEIDAKAMADITATFDAGQKAVWKEFTGEPFDVSKLTSATTPLRGFGSPGGFGRAGGTDRNTSIVTLWTREAVGHTVNGEYAAALAVYDEAIRLAPTSSLFVQNKARLLATCPSEWVRDGKQAVELMKKAMAEAKEPTYTQYDVLAAAHAECGQFDEAVKAQQKAIALLPPPRNPDDTGGFGGGRGFTPTATLKPQYEARLKLYQEKKPYRMEPRASRVPADR